MGRKTKRVKLKDAPPTSGIQILDLKDDLISAIFDHLSPIDLCSMSFTCKRIQTLAFNQFHQKYPNEVIVIDSQSIANKTSYVFSNLNGKYVKYFGKCIPNVKLFDVPSTRQLFEFVKAECCPKLKSLDIVGKSHIYPEDSEIIRVQLEKLESLIVRHMRPSNDIYRILLKHCKNNIKHLTIQTFPFRHFNWLLQHYPKLRSFSIQLYNDRHCVASFTGHAVRFFRNNPQIKDISCYERDVLKIILRNVINIERLAINCEKWDANTHNLRLILGDLRTYCQKSPIQCLEFQSRHFFMDPKAIENLDMLCEFNKVHAIHGLKIAFNQHLELSSGTIPMVMNFKYLKELNVNTGSVDDSIVSDFMKRIAKEMVHLEELTISAHTKQLPIQETFLMPFVRDAVKLERLKIDIGTCIKIKIEQRDLWNMNAARKCSPEANRMDICIITSSFELQFNIPSVGSVNVKTF